ncbi:MAG: hypothetical protein HQ567_08645 [Candidatus Nealsonbacteria bacterium]|nr:hypothetical protein [Candidatus Nealsonbacteria bacterium]
MNSYCFSLASLFLLTAVVAVFFAAIGPNMEATDRDTLTVCTVVGLIIGALTGTVIGAGQDRPGRSILLTLPTGVIAGAASGALLAVPGKFLTIAVGSLLLLLISLVVRSLSKWKDTPPASP